VPTVNDLDLLRTVRADAPVPDRHRLDAGRERLLRAIDSPAGRPRRRLGGRRGPLLAGAATAVAAAAAAAVITQTGVGPATLRTAPAAVSAKYGNPLVERAAFGWLPDGLRTNGYIADHQHERYLQITAQSARKTVTLTAYAPGREPILPHLPGDVPARRIPAASINGHSAYWIFKPDAAGQSTFELRWKYADNSWADLQGDGLRGTGAELTGMAYRIARSATFGGNRPIAMPLHIGGVPGGLSPERTVLNDGAHGQVSAILDYLATEPYSGLSVGIVENAGGRHPANGTLDGHPAYRRRGILYVFGVNGFDVQLSASGPFLAKLNKTGGLVGLFHNITILGSDPANWTTSPVN
jgi:hypothetical protein